MNIKTWCARQRMLYHLGKLDPKRVKMLESLCVDGVQWSWGRRGQSPTRSTRAYPGQAEIQRAIEKVRGND